VPNRTEQLIQALAQDVTPVTRVRSPVVRAAQWLTGFALLGGLAIFSFANLDVFIGRAEHLDSALEIVGTIATGCLAIVAAFHLSLPDRSLRWALLPLPALVVWLAGSGASCYRQWVIDRDDAWRVGESGDCFLFILAVGIPVGAALQLALRRSKPIEPLRVATVGGLGAAGLAAFALQFFHPFDVTMMDLTIHAVAVGVVIWLLTWRRSWAFGA
jgi:hypothetical protein